MALLMSKATNCPGPGWEGNSWPRHSGPRCQLSSRVTTCFDKAQNSTDASLSSISSLGTSITESRSIGSSVLAQLPTQSKPTRVGDLIFGLITPTTASDLLLSCLGSLTPGKQISISPIDFDVRERPRQVKCGWRLAFLRRLRTLPSTYELVWVPSFFGSYTKPKPLAPENEKQRPSTTIRRTNLSFVREVFGIQTVDLLRQLPIAGLRENLGIAFGFFDAIHVLVAFRACMSPPAGAGPRYSFMPTTPVRSDNSRKRKSAQSFSIRDDDDDATSDSSPLAPEPKKTKINTEKTNARWACHYCKLDPVEYRSCLNRQHSAPRRVKEHLLRCHLQKVHCPICQHLFEDRKSRDQHINRRRCEPSDPSPEFVLQIDEDQENLLRTIKGGDGKEYWLRIWNILFPDRPEPASPIVTDDDWEALGRLSLIRRTETVFRERLRSNIPDLDVEQIMRIWLAVVDHQPLHADSPTPRRTRSAIGPPEDPGQSSTTRSSFSAAGSQQAQAPQLAVGSSSSTLDSSAAATTFTIPVQPHTDSEVQSYVQPSQVSNAVAPSSQASVSVAINTAPQFNSSNTDVWQMPVLEDLDSEFGAGTANDNTVIPRQTGGENALTPNHFGPGFPQNPPNLFGWPAAQDVMDYTSMNNHATMLGPFGWMAQGNFLGLPFGAGLPTWSPTPTGQETLLRHPQQHYRSGAASNTAQQSRGQWAQRTQPGGRAATDSHSSGERPRNQPQLGLPRY